MILLPVMVNIVFVNQFYLSSPGAYLNALAFTFGLVLLLGVDIKKLKLVFWEFVERLPPVVIGRIWTKHALRLLPIVAAFLTVYQLIANDKSDKLLIGTWTVQRLTRNGTLVPANAWLNDPKAWNRVYFDGQYGCAFSPNPYRFRTAESLVGEYTFDSVSNRLEVVFKRGDTLQSVVRLRTTNTLHFQGILRTDTLDVDLIRSE